MAGMKFDKMSSLAGELEQIESSFADVQNEDLTHTCGALLGALEEFKDSRFALGRMLPQYKQYFRADRGWAAAAQAIGAAIDRNERTVTGSLATARSRLSFRRSPSALFKE